MTRGMSFDSDGDDVVSKPIYAQTDSDMGDGDDYDGRRSLKIRK
jgi:hypothetical protein